MLECKLCKVCNEMSGVAKHCIAVVPKIPAANCAYAAAAKQDNDNDSNDDALVALFGFLGGSDRHVFRHNLFSLKNIRAYNDCA